MPRTVNMTGMFLGADGTYFNQPLNNWNVSSLSWHDNEVFFDFNGYMASSTNMESMFQGAISFNQPLHAPWYHDEESDSE